MTTVKASLLAFFLLQTLNAFSQAGNNADADRLVELDAFWKEVSRTIEEGDFEGYAHTFHEEATLVSGISGVCYPIATALAGWKNDFDTTKSGERSSSVVFRFSRRLGDATTAYESGIFHYSFEVNGEKQGYYIHFDGLLVKEGTWKMMMEYQKRAATKEDWDALE
ncbi:nuclear transport factor 2 family protein [Cyclobacterium jeungdonense]|uniref:Nuclear transport factor 2 family protein n=1 Tax=Cyclobacterium jeungdonense TaxID=708087 RepID=A0ABT8C7V8_9BACT|nr:nuclear transport factor 2 family protein [Cyclobacterium jeungdonense]MDN3688849.1 nuclear transport factor 2 family protein [Cyclobacterium jeungdonense]